MPRSETPLRSDLFPEISPYASGMLAVDGRHTIYWEQDSVDSIVKMMEERKAEAAKQ